MIMHLENIHESIECLSDYVKNMIKNGTGSGKVNLRDAGEMVDMLKDLAEAEYYSKITHAMDKSDEEKEDEEKYLLQKMKEEYGEDDGQRYYNEYRYANGRYAPKGRGTRRGYESYLPEVYMMRPEYHRDMDRADGRMYYPDHEWDMDRQESRYDRSRRTYEESKAMHRSGTPEDEKENTRSLESLMMVLEDDLNDALPKMSASEKAMMKNKLATWSNKI